jgi:predicted RNase H-like nuclease (RuvC/YqgF family)
MSRLLAALQGTALPSLFFCVHNVRMHTAFPPPLKAARAGLLGASLWVGLAAVAQSPSTYYVCPGNTFTNTITPKEADQRGCKLREAQQPTTISGPRPRPQGDGNSNARTNEGRIDSADQRARDTDARRILEQELKREEAALEGLRAEYKGGQPERRGDERNFQKYQDRVAELKAAISRKESDLDAIRRELNKLPS